MAARIDLNPARAVMVEDPEEFLRGGRRWGEKKGMGNLAEIELE
jgi:hypothetical protein